MITIVGMDGFSLVGTLRCSVLLGIAVGRQLGTGKLSHIRCRIRSFLPSYGF